MALNRHSVEMGLEMVPLVLFVLQPHVPVAQKARTHK